MKTYAWNFVVTKDEDGKPLVLVKRPISNDSIGVMKLNSKGELEFWSHGRLLSRTKDFGVLFKDIAKVERRT